jgi:hypothetical protein
MLDQKKIDNIPIELDCELALIESRVDTSMQLQKPPTILSVNETTTVVHNKRIFTLGNFSCITGKMKAKKTFLVGLFASSVIKGADYNNNFKGELPEEKKLVVYIDTEQSDYDSNITIRRIEKMAENKEMLLAFNLRKFSPKERLNIIEFIFNKYQSTIGMIIIDGIADLVMKINDEEEATMVTSMLLKYTAEYNCHACIVIHENKNNDFATGHIGSSVMKKAEIIISSTKCKNIKDSSDIECKFSRGPGFSPFVMTINEYGYPYVNNKVAVENKEQEPDCPF